MRLKGWGTGGRAVIVPGLLPVFIFWFALAAASAGEKLSHVQGIVHVHSTLSTGNLSIPVLAKRARDEGIRIIFFTDHSLMKISYGLPFFPALLKVTRVKPSVIISGPESYLKSIAEARSLFPDMVLIPGVESAPFYYWKGSLLKRDLKVVDWRKHLLVLGSEEPGFYAGLPVIHNVEKGFRWDEVGNLSGLYIFFLPLVIGVMMLWWEKPYRVVGAIIMGISLMAIGNFALARGTLYGPHEGDLGVTPYQMVIDYGNEHGALVYWAHPESNLTLSSMETVLGPISFETSPHPEDLLLTQNYTGFEAMYKDIWHLTDPGKEWDQALIQHVSGERASPVWGIAGLDFHGSAYEGEEEKIADVVTVFMLEELNKEAVLEAMRRGRVYSLWRTGGYRLVLEDFRVRSVRGHDDGISGDHVKVKGYPQVDLKIVASDGSSRELAVSLVRNGEQVAAFKGTTPFEGRFVDDLEKPRGMLYYRIDVKGPEPHRIISNPVFVDVERGS